MLFKFTTREELINSIYEKANFNYVSLGNLAHRGISANGKLPFSISENEFNYIRNFIAQHGLNRGLDLATGTCIGTIACAEGMRYTGGKLLTIDSYIEEKTQNIFEGTGFTPVNALEGLERNKKIIKNLGLGDVVEFKVGWFPDDCINGKWVEDSLGWLDFALIDCLKNYKDFTEGMKKINHFFHKCKFAIFVHDTHTWKSEFIKASIELYNIEPLFLYNFTFGDVKDQQYYPIALITNIPNIE